MNIQEQPRKKLLTISEVATYLNIKEKTIYAKVEAGEIPHYRIGHLIRFKLDEIDAWLVTCIEKESDTSAVKRKRRRSSKLASDQFSKNITKTIDEETDKYYSVDNGKSDRIKGLIKEVNNGSI
jgi:excisionase family DNA binding protein